MMLGMKWEAWDQELHGTGGFVGGHADVDWLTGGTRSAFHYIILQEKRLGSRNLFIYLIYLFK